MKLKSLLLNIISKCIQIHKKEILVSHYMTLLQKLMSIINYDLMRICFKLAADYDFVLDPDIRKRRMLKRNTRHT
jgi:hypothetical protein